MERELSQPTSCNEGTKIIKALKRALDRFLGVEYVIVCPDGVARDRLRYLDAGAADHDARYFSGCGASWHHRDCPGGEHTVRKEFVR